MNRIARRFPSSEQVWPHRAGPVRRTVRRVAVHSAHLISSLLSDDWAGRRLRRHLFRMFGARLNRGASIHGGTYVSDPANLYMGQNSFINRDCYLDLEGQLFIGPGVTVGHGVTFVTTEHLMGDEQQRCGPAHGRSISVREGVWIGANATVMPGVTIGAGAVVAAGAVVIRDVPPNRLVGGVPAQILRSLDAEPLRSVALG